MKKYLNFWPILYILIVWFIFASPYFLNSKVPYPSTYQVDHFHPWSDYIELKGPVKNGAMPDIIDQIYPWRHFTIESLKSGKIPFWNPNSFAGNPHLANYQSAVLSPFNILFLILPFVDGWSLIVLLQPLIAGLGMYIFMREMKVSKIGAAISSVSFMFCGFVVVWMAYGTLSLAISFLPLSLFGIEAFAKTRKKRFLFLLAATIPLSFFSGHFQISIYFLLATFFYTLYKGIISKDLYVMGYTLSAIFLGLFFSLPQILPSIEFYNYAVRSEIFIEGTGIPLQHLITSFAPDFFGNPVTGNDWFGAYAEWSSFVGVIPLLLALYAVISKDKRTFFFIFLGFFALLMSVDSMFQTVIGFLKIPVLSTSNPTRIIVLFGFAVAVLSGIGIDVLQNLLARKNIKKLVTVCFIIMIILLCAWGIILFGKSYSPEQLEIARRNLLLPTGLLTLALFGIFTAYLHKIIIMLFAVCLLLATSFDSFRFAQKWMPFDPKNLVFMDVPVIEAIQKNVGNGRVFGNIGAQVATYYDIPIIEGYDPLYIKRYGEFIRSSNGGFEKAERSVVKIGRDAKYIDRVLDLLAVNLIFHPVPDTNQNWAYPVWEDTKRFSLVYSDGKFQLFRNNDALSHASLFYSYEVIKDDKSIIKRFYNDNFDFRKTLILEENLEEQIKDGSGSAKITLYSPIKIVIEVNTSTPALLFLSDNYYPGWSAYINNKKTKIYRTDYTFRSVIVPSGKSVVEFIYENWNI